LRVNSRPVDRRIAGEAGLKAQRFMRALALLACCAALAACGHRAKSEPRVNTLAEFTASLRQAGADVQDTALAATPAFGVPGVVLQVDQALVQVFEFQSPADRQATQRRLLPDGSLSGEPPIGWPVPPRIWASGRLLVIYPGDDGGAILLLSGLLGDPINGPTVGKDEPYPPGVTAAIEELAAELSFRPGAVSVLDFQAVDWPDSCLGLPVSGETCLTRPTSGWRVVLQAGGKIAVLRTDEFGKTVRMEH
jgi:hypothetical protein